MRFLRCSQHHFTFTVLKVWVFVRTECSILQLTQNDAGSKYWTPNQLSNCTLRIHAFITFIFLRELQQICSHSIGGLLKINVANGDLYLPFLQALSSSVVWSQNCDVKGSICGKLN